MYRINLPSGYQRLILSTCLLFAWNGLSLAADSNQDLATGSQVGGDPSLEQDIIDRYVEEGWQRAGVTPSSRCDDATFVRRAFLDLVGRIPTVDERAEFIADTDGEKRRRLIDDLLASPAYARHMADVFDVLLLGRSSSRGMNQRTMHGWIDYLTESFAANRPWDQMAREMVLARPIDGADVRAGWFLYERRDRHQDIAEAIAPAFFGIRIECAQCHDHPLASEILQEHYWGLVAFFNRSENKNTDQGPRVIEKASGGTQNYTDLAGDSYPMALTFFESAVVDEPASTSDDEESDDDYVQAVAGEPRIPKFSRRRQFVDQILDGHPLLARSFVNRMWALLIGQGIVHPHDRMDSMHDAANTELLESLAEDFEQSGYDVQRLVRLITSSRCYQLSSEPADSNALPSHFAFGLTKLLPAESFLRSIEVTLQRRKGELDPELLREFRETFPDILPDEPRSTVAQALFLTNHDQLNQSFSASGSETIAAIAELPELDQRVEAAYLVALGRQPSDDERTLACQFASSRSAETAVAQLMWALVTSSEFRVNH